jgi:hypothetical protein
MNENGAAAPPLPRSSLAGKRADLDQPAQVFNLGAVSQIEAFGLLHQIFAAAEIHL